MKILIASLMAVAVLAGCGIIARADRDKAPEAASFAGGGLCGDPQLVGEPVGRVPGEIAGCGVENAVSLRAVGNVQLSQAATVDCPTAQAFKTWVQTGVEPLVESRGGLVSLRVAAHYVCRTRNHQAGAKISEHGKGKAIDISAMTLGDGSEVTVLEGWPSKRDGALLREMHRAACGPFGTVLGPESDRWHKDHFHFDTASYRSGSYCR